MFPRRPIRSANERTLRGLKWKRYYVVSIVTALKRGPALYAPGLMFRVEVVKIRCLNGTLL